MSFFSWLKQAITPEKIQRDHEYFGKIELTSGTSIHGSRYEFWSTPNLQTPICSKPITIIIRAGVDGPNEEHKLRLEKLFDKFPTLQDAIRREQFKEWTSMKNDMLKHSDSIIDASRFDNPDAMDELFELGSVEISKDGGYELGYSFRDEDLWPDLQMYFAINTSWNVSFSGAAD